MKGLYCRAVSDAEPKFVIQEMTLPDVLSSHQVRVQVKACGLNLVMHHSRVLIFVSVSLFVCFFLTVGPKVTFFQPEDEVRCVTAFALTLLCTHMLVWRPDTRSWSRTDLIARTSNDLIPLAAKSFGLMCIQLACYHGAKVLTTSHSPQNHTFLEQLRPSVARVIPVYNSSSELLSAVMEETGGLGVDIVVDSGVESEEKKLLPHKHDIISVLGVGSHWVTSHQDLQLDPPDCRLLYLKSASVSFLNPEVWTPEEAVPLYEATVAMETVQRHPKTKAVVQL
uniref:Crystallin, zeta (quinone reductase)-like 1 n=1 Tax=Haplochromis burtoni TaxID=8153 RepID=A0A3Q2XEN5_HAPBU